MSVRLDKWLVINNFFSTRNKAQNAIKSSLVLVNNKVINNNHYEVNDHDQIEVIQSTQYVSRGAIKLLEAKNKFKINFKNKVVLDIGSSTGGFSQIVLINNAKQIYCVDVGTNQLDPSLRNQSKLVVYENTNFKDLTKEMFNQTIDIIVSDLSFISLTKLLPKIKELFNHHIDLYLLIKPQFELTKVIVNKSKGVIKDKKYWLKAIDNVVTNAKSLGYKINQIIDSPILGSDGNKEFFVYMELN